MHSKRLFGLCLVLSCAAHVVLFALGTHVPRGVRETSTSMGGEPIRIRLIDVRISDVEDSDRREAEAASAERDPEILAFKDPTLQEDTIEPLQSAEKSADAQSTEESPPQTEVVSLPSEEREVYWNHVRQAVAQELRYPQGWQRRGRGGTVLLRMVLDDNGALIVLESLSRTGDPLFVRMAMEAVRRAAPFEPPSEHGLEKRRLEAELPIRFTRENQ